MISDGAELRVSCLICPICGLPLILSRITARCPRSHAFDVSRDGYINLLVSQAKVSALAGDSREMLLARRRFLERGLYRPLSGAIIAIVSAKIGDPKQVTARHDDSCIIDAGCGEGSYLGRLQAILRETHRDDAPVCVGVDIAKEAARLAARQYEEPCFVVADTWKRLPVASASVLALLNVFAPRNVAEFARVLSPSGLLLVVIPGDDHLTELRRTLSLLTIQADKEAAVLEQFEGPFRREETRTIVCELDLDREALRDLLLMMPGSRHMAPDAWQAAQRLEHIETSAHFRLMTFSRR